MTSHKQVAKAKKVSLLTGNKKNYTRKSNVSLNRIAVLISTMSQVTSVPVVTDK
jgi:hypothetical protein